MIPRACFVLAVGLAGIASAIPARAQPLSPRNAMDCAGSIEKDSISRMGRVSPPGDLYDFESFEIESSGIGSNIRLFLSALF